LGFGVAFADLDHDADLDLVVANGHVLDNTALVNPGSSYAQRNQTFENLGKGSFRETEDDGLDVVRVSRGTATGDLDGDGDLDLIIVNLNDRAELYQNTGAAGSWVLVDLAGADGNRFAIGARVELLGASGRQLQEVRTASSYSSQNALSLHFGLGDAETVEELLVRWTSGRTRLLRSLPANSRILIRE
jgi:hypothetical protein